MARALKLLSLLLLLALVLLGASGFIVRSLLSGASKDALLERLGRTAKVKVAVDTIDLDLAAWYRLQPTLALRGIKVGNPEGYRGASLIEADALEAQVEVRPLLSGDLRVRAIGLRQPRFYIEKAKDGTTNIEAFLKGLAAGRPPGDDRRELVVDKVEVTGCEIHVAGAGGATASRTFHHLDVTIDGFAAGRPSRFQVESRLWNGQVSRLRIEGAAGPFAAQSIPLDAKLAATVAPAEVPADIRRAQFGALLAQAPAAARVNLEAALQGDAFQVLSGKARVVLAGLEVGDDPNARLPVSGEVPAMLTISRIMSTPVIQLQASNGTLKVGSGQWKGKVSAVSAGGLVRGSSGGSLTGVGIDEFLGAFASSRGQVDGKLDVPSYSLRFAGRTARDIRSSLAGNARAEVSEGKLRLLDLLGAISRAVARTPGAGAEAGQTQFTTLATDLAVGGQKLNIENLILKGPGLNAGGSGMIGFDESLQLRLKALVGGRIAELLGRRTAEGKAAEVAIPITIGGSLRNPSITPDIGKLATGAVKSIFGDLLKKMTEPKKAEK